MAYRLTGSDSGPYEVLIEANTDPSPTGVQILNSDGVNHVQGVRPIHPGEILLEDYIKPIGVSVRTVAVALHFPYSRLSEITKGERGVSADTALRLERYFGSEAKGWLNLQAAYELRVAEIENGRAIAKEIQPIAPAARATLAAFTSNACIRPEAVRCER
jgi:addiction module HigA family antidote